MSDKRYQVFVSSTYADLKEERDSVIRVLMDMDCIPTGMELFPAADEDQWEFIKRIIEDSDYYLLIIGGRYGSLTNEGISYTEKEFDYAAAIGRKIVALIHEAPDDIPLGKSEKNPEMRAKLEEFKEKVKVGRLVKFWSKPSELPGLVALNIQKVIKSYPAIGWVRADSVASQDVLVEINALRKANQELERKAGERPPKSISKLPDLAPLESEITLHGKYRPGGPGANFASFSTTQTWKDVFAVVAPFLAQNPPEASVNKFLAKELLRRKDRLGYSIHLQDADLQTVRVQLQALELVNVRYAQATSGGWGLFWSLTTPGNALMFKLRTVRSTPEGPTA